MIQRIIESSEDLGTISTTTSSTALDMDAIATLSVQCRVTNAGGVTGTLAFQRTNAHAADGGPSTTDADWDDITSATAISAAGNTWFIKIGPEYRYFRVQADVSVATMDVELFYCLRGTEQ